MSFVHIVLAGVASLLLGALVFSYATMRQTEKEEGYAKIATEYTKENLYLESELSRLRHGGAFTPTASYNKNAITKEELQAIEQRNTELKKQLAKEEALRSEAEQKAQRAQDIASGKLDRQAREQRLISQALVVATATEVASEDGIYVIVLNVKEPQAVRIGTELALRRHGEIIGKVQVSNTSGDTYFADPLSETFAQKKVDVVSGDTFILSPL